jgi:hypothetical protein
MMDFDVVSGLVASLGAMKFFPADPPVRVALVQTMGEMTDDVDAVRWLVKKLRTEYAEWPGEHEMRKIFCTRFRPLDGVVVCDGDYGPYTFTLAPGQPWPKAAALPAPERKQLEAAPMCAQAQAVVDLLVQNMPKMPSAKFAGPSDARAAGVRRPPEIGSDATSGPAERKDKTKC